MSRKDESSLHEQATRAVFGRMALGAICLWASVPGLARAQSEEGQLDEPAAEDPAASPSEGVTPDPGDPASPTDPVPADEDGIDPVDESTAPADEPDYYGSYEPLGPSLRYNDAYQPKKPPYDGPFRGGRFRLGLSIGGGTYGTETYFIPGFSVGYFLLNGLELHVDTDFWLIGDPFLATPSPGLRYVFWMLPKVHPYLGGFYRHYFVGSGYDDANSVGARAGVYFMIGRNSFFGLGAAYEHMLEDHLFASRDFIYPEISFVFAF
jgi:hypothetical protein